MNRERFLRRAQLVGEYSLGIDAGILIKEAMLSVDSDLGEIESENDIFQKAILHYMQVVATLGAIILRSSANSVGRIHSEIANMDPDASTSVKVTRVAANAVIGISTDVLRIGLERYACMNIHGINNLPFWLTFGVTHILGNTINGVYNVAKGRGRSGTF